MGDKHGEDREESHLQVKKVEALLRIFREFNFMNAGEQLLRRGYIFVNDIYLLNIIPRTSGVVEFLSFGETQTII